MSKSIHHVREVHKHYLWIRIRGLESLNICSPVPGVTNTYFVFSGPAQRSKLAHCRRIQPLSLVGFALGVAGRWWWEGVLWVGDGRVGRSGMDEKWMRRLRCTQSSKLHLQEIWICRLRNTLNRELQTILFGKCLFDMCDYRFISHIHTFKILVGCFENVIAVRVTLAFDENRTEGWLKRCDWHKHVWKLL